MLFLAQENIFSQSFQTIRAPSHFKLVNVQATMIISKTQFLKPTTPQKHYNLHSNFLSTLEYAEMQLMEA